jgi:site-specific DNA recombinase
MAKKNIDGTRNHTKLKPENEIVRVPHAIPQIIDTEMFEKAQKMLAEKQRSDHKTYTRGKYLLTGLVKCAQCHLRMSGHTNRGGKKKEVRVIYRCRTKQEGTNCKTKAINVLYLDAYILKQLSSLMQESNRVAFFTLYKTSIETLKNAMRKKLKDNLKIIKLYTKERENLQSLMRTSKRTLERILTEQMQDIESELHQSQVLQRRLQKEITYLEYVNTDYVEDRLIDLRDQLSHPHTRKEALFQLVREIILHNDMVHVVLIFNSFLEHEIEEEIVFKFTENREHIALKTHHHLWRRVTI